MTKYYIHPFALNITESGGGIPLHGIFRAFLKDCGIECLSDCPDDYCAPSVTTRKVSTEWTDKSFIEEGFKIILLRLESIEKRNAELEAEIAQLRQTNGQ